MVKDIGSIIGGAATAATSLYNIGDSLFGGTKHKSHEQMRYQHEMNKRAVEEITKPYYEWQQRETPQLQVSGLKKAGINPLSVFGSNTSLPGGDSISPAAPPDSSAAFSSIQQGKQVDLASSLGIAEVMKTLAETKKTNAETIGQNEENKRIHTFNEFAKQLYSAQAQSAEGLVTLQGIQVKLGDADIKKVYATVNNLEADTKNKQQEYFNLCQSFDNLVSQQKLTDAQREEVISNVALNAARLVREKFGIELDKAQLGLLHAQTSLAISQGNVLYPAECLSNFLRSNPYFTRQYGAAQYWVQFSNGNDSQIHTQIKQGGLARVAAKRLRRVSTKFRQGQIVDGIIESTGFATDILNVVTDALSNSLGSIGNIGNLSK